jgi:hypothetical protein
MWFKILLVLLGWCVGAGALAILVGKSVYRGNRFENPDTSKDLSLKQGLQSNSGAEHSQSDRDHPLFFQL